MMPSQRDMLVAIGITLTERLAEHGKDLLLRLADDGAFRREVFALCAEAILHGPQELNMQQLVAAIVAYHEANPR